MSAPLLLVICLFVPFTHCQFPLAASKRAEIETDAELTTAISEESGNGTEKWTDNFETQGEMNELRRKIKQMENQIEQLKENSSKCENNHWNPEDCHHELFLLKPKLVKIVCRGKDEFYRSVRAKFAQSEKLGIIYFEVKIVMLQRNNTRDIGIGLAPKSVPLNRTGIGKLNDTYAFFDDGFIFGHNIGGYGGNANFRAGDVIGCGIDLARHQIIYTKNGERLNTTNMLVHSFDLFPAVSLRNPGDIVEANFGPLFKYEMPDGSVRVHSAVSTVFLVFLLFGSSLFRDQFFNLHFGAN
ncbi:hypothetical protein niasHT_039545 [Heterodera trifolii]|uniref:B30.2/SPRY domain-containing protein n=1 Tax=Heterodera trifolii TaxID=157864 RepID=A0ABD2I969_9BILA